jgi:protein-disulfide isomerase
VYYVFKDFPIVALHPQAGLAAQAAECAGEQGGYWSMHSRLFEQPDEWSSGPEQALSAFLGYAEELQLDSATFDQCLQAGDYADEVGRDVREAQMLGLSGTPAFIINGKLLSGARPAEQFLQVLDRELQGQ